MSTAPTIDDFARACAYEPNEADSKLWDGVVLRHKRVGTIGAEARAFAIAMMWLTYTRSDEVVLLVTPTSTLGEAFVELVQGMIASGMQADFRLGRILVSKSRVGLGYGNSNQYTVVHCRPVDLAVPLPVDQNRYTVLVPDMNQVPGCYLRDIAALSQDERVVVAMNVPA